MSKASNSRLSTHSKRRKGKVSPKPMVEQSVSSTDSCSEGYTSESEDQSGNITSVCPELNVEWKQGSSSSSLTDWGSPSEEETVSEPESVEEVQTVHGYKTGEIRKTSRQRREEAIREHNNNVSRSKPVPDPVSDSESEEDVCSCENCTRKRLAEHGHGFNPHGLDMGQCYKKEVHSSSDSNPSDSENEGPTDSDSDSNPSDSDSDKPTDLDQEEADMEKYEEMYIHPEPESWMIQKMYDDQAAYDERDPERYRYSPSEYDEYLSHTTETDEDEVELTEAEKKRNKFYKSLGIYSEELNGINKEIQLGVRIGKFEFVERKHITKRYLNLFNRQGNYYIPKVTRQDILYLLIFDDKYHFIVTKDIYSKWDCAPAYASDCYTYFFLNIESGNYFPHYDRAWNFHKDVEIWTNEYSPKITQNIEVYENLECSYHDLLMEMSIETIGADEKRCMCILINRICQVLDEANMICATLGKDM